MEKVKPYDIARISRMMISVLFIWIIIHVNRDKHFVLIIAKWKRCKQKIMPNVCA